MRTLLTLKLTVPAAAALALIVGACATAPPPGPLAANKTVGRKIDEVMAANGPASGQWDLPDGRRVYQWQEISVMARVGASEVSGEVSGAASQTTCYTTLYTRPDAAGRFKVISYEAPRPGCLKLAMNTVTTR
jgi:hypothetical protein